MGDLHRYYLDSKPMGWSLRSLLIFQAFSAMNLGCAPMACSSSPFLRTAPSVPIRSFPRAARAIQSESSARQDAGRTCTTGSLSRRETFFTSVGGSALLGLSLGLPNPAAAERLPSGFTPVKDKGDNYRFLAPFGWQEVDVEGEDVVWKDVIEPLESVSVSITPTSKTDIKDFGPLDDVCFTLADTVLTSPSQEVKLLAASSRDVAGITYFNFEFAAKAPNYIRHALSVVTVFNGNFYALTTGSNERRWNKVKDKLMLVSKSFQVNVFWFQSVGEVLCSVCLKSRTRRSELVINGSVFWPTVLGNAFSNTPGPTLSRFVEWCWQHLSTKVKMQHGPVTVLLTFVLNIQFLSYSSIRYSCLNPFAGQFEWVLLWDSRWSGEFLLILDSFNLFIHNWGVECTYYALDLSQSWPKTGGLLKFYFLTMNESKVPQTDLVTCPTADPIDLQYKRKKTHLEYCSMLPMTI